MVKLTFEMNSADGIRACAIAVPADRRGKDITLETNSEFVRLTIGNERSVIYIPDGKCNFSVPYNAGKHGEEVIVKAEAVNSADA